jgi:hypothetical protein
MPATYLLKDANGTTLATLPSVLEPVSLTGVATNVTSGTENQVTVASTTGLFPGMPVSIPNIPEGSFIHAIRSATVIELYRSAWDVTTGVFTSSAANANATAAASGLLGQAHGFDPRCLIAAMYARGTWRNKHKGNTPLFTASVGGTPQSQITLTPGAALIPTTHTVTTGYATMTAGEIRLTDEMAATPLKRHNGEVWACRYVVHTGGHVSIVPADPSYTLHYNGPDA